MGVATLVAYSPGCDGRSPNLKTLIRYKNYLQDHSTLFLQGAFFIEKSVKKEKRIKQYFKGNIESISLN